MTTGIMGSTGAAGAMAGSGSWRFIHRGIRIRALSALGAVALVATLFPAGAPAQELAVSAGGEPGELRCPVVPHKHRGRAWRKKHSGVVMEMPSNEELADLPLQEETQHQDIALQGDDKYDASQPFAIALWGDSHTASDFFSEEMMRTSGIAQDQVQPTFIPATMGHLGVRLPIRKFCLSDGWKHDYAYVSREENILAAKGLGDISSHVSGSYLWVDFRASGAAPDLQSLDVLFAPPARGREVRVGITVDGGEEHVVGLDPAAHGVLQIKADRPMSIVKLRLVEGPLVLQGFVPHYVRAPSLYFDTFAIPGSTAHAWKALDPDYFRSRGNDIRYDLVIMEYGTNEGNDRHFDPAKYESDLRVSLQKLRAVYPDSMCVLIGPPDRGVLIQRPRRGRHSRVVKPSHVDLLKYARVHERIGEIQGAVSKEYSCAYWSWQQAMGGPGAAYNWMRRSPALMSRDLTHLTMPGYQLSARIFTQDIGLSRILERRGKPARAETPPRPAPAAQTGTASQAETGGQAGSRREKMQP